MKTFFSLLIPFRDRDTNVLERCLKAIQAQVFQNFEVLFLDYGCKQGIGVQARLVCEKYNCVRHFHSDTEGKLWCKAEALNFLTLQAAGKYVMVCDADILLQSPDFLKLAYQEILKLAYPKVLELRCCETNAQGKQGRMRTGRGICMLERSFLVENGGYDTFFRQWGVEDDEILMRLERAVGEKFPVFVPERAPLLHIWHPHDYSKMPKGWLALLQAYASAPKQSRSLPAQTLLAYTDRPAMLKMHSEDRADAEKITLEQPMAYHFTHFLARFSELRAGKFLYIDQKFDFYADEKQTFVKKIVRFLNKIFSKMGFSYRFTDIRTSERGLLTVLEVRDFIFYFLVHFEAQILDYYFDYDQEHIVFWVCKRAD